MEENQIYFEDWNKKSLDELSEYLENKYQFNSSGEAKAIFTLIDFYKKNKEINEKYNQLYQDLNKIKLFLNPFTGKQADLLKIIVNKSLKRGKL